MAQLTIYLDDETIEVVRQAASKEGISQSQWVAALIRRKTEKEWPQHIRELPGQWNDFPDQTSLRQHSADSRRENL